MKGSSSPRFLFPCQEIHSGVVITRVRGRFDWGRFDQGKPYPGQNDPSQNDPSQNDPGVVMTRVASQPWAK